MVIGFSQRSQTVSEGMVLFEADLLQFQIEIETLITSEREHSMIFRLEESSSTAIVDPVTLQTNPKFDALFGDREVPGGPLVEYFDLISGENAIPPIITIIRNDFYIEDEECYTIRVLPNTFVGRRELFICKDDDAERYFCKFTLCISDNDGKWKNGICGDNNNIIVSFSTICYRFC